MQTSSNSSSASAQLGASPRHRMRNRLLNSGSSKSASTGFWPVITSSNSLQKPPFSPLSEFDVFITPAFQPKAPTSRARGRFEKSQRKVIAVAEDATAFFSYK